ncbi:hypothetical protein AB0D08_27695 [Kitasatospora sp. NPDC048540]|uniref:hypothetical protein n=1 Tax=Kitasatospora sp. NPDC048540 TaxID=3155634 RepID=UPI0033DBDB82
MTDSGKYLIPHVPPGRKQFSYRPAGARWWTTIPITMVQKLAIIANEAPIVQGGQYGWRALDVAAGESRRLWAVEWEQTEPKRTGFTVTHLTSLGKEVLEDYFRKNPPSAS